MSRGTCIFIIDLIFGHDRFKYQCLELLDSVESTAKSTLPANRRHLHKYLGPSGTGEIRIIAESVYTDTLSFHGELSDSGYQALEKLRRQTMAAEVEAMKARLTQPKYQLDSPAAVVAICGSHQVELVSRQPHYLSG